VITFLASEDSTTRVLGEWLDAGQPAPLVFEQLPDRDTVLRSLCGPDGDPDSQQWAQALLAQQPPQGHALWVDLAAKPAGVALLASLEPRALLQLPRLCRLQHAAEGEPINLEPDAVAMLLDGSCSQRSGERLSAGQSTAAPITMIGLIDYLLGHGTGPDPALTGLSAAPGGCRWLTFQRRQFRELIDITPVLEALMIRQLALANRRSSQASQI
jgi:hypothetical protein